jgi:hypothetical protein
MKHTNNIDTDILNYLRIICAFFDLPLSLAPFFFWCAYSSESTSGHLRIIMNKSRRRK